MENGRMVVVAGGVGGIGSKIVDRFLANGGMIFAIDAIKRDEQPEDLVGPVFFLASPEANFMSGQMLVVDGGKIKH